MVQTTNTPYLLTVSLLSLFTQEGGWSSLLRTGGFAVPHYNWWAGQDSHLVLYQCELIINYTVSAVKGKVWAHKQWWDFITYLKTTSKSRRLQHLQCLNWLLVQHFIIHLVAILWDIFNKSINYLKTLLPNIPHIITIKLLHYEVLCCVVLM